MDSARTKDHYTQRHGFLPGRNVIRLIAQTPWRVPFLSKRTISYRVRTTTAIFRSNLKPTPVRNPTPRSVYIDRKLSTCSHVFVRHDAVKIGLQRPYDGPYKVLQRTDKYFKINLNGIVDNVSIDRLKPAILLSDYEEHSSSSSSSNLFQSQRSLKSQLKQKQAC